MSLGEPDRQPKVQPPSGDRGGRSSLSSLHRMTSRGVAVRWTTAHETPQARQETRPASPVTRTRVPQTPATTAGPGPVVRQDETPKASANRPPAAASQVVGDEGRGPEGGISPPD